MKKKNNLSAGKNPSPKENLKTELHDLERRISMRVGQFLILVEEGSHIQIIESQQKAISEVLKIGGDMEKLAEQIGGSFPLFVHEFLDKIDILLHTAPNYIDAAKITQCFNATQKLEKAIGE